MVRNVCWGVAACAVGLLGCASTPAPAPSTNSVTAPPLAASGPSSGDLELARAMAKQAGSTNPELRALQDMVAQTTPELGLEQVLGARGSSPPEVLRKGDRVKVTVLRRDELGGEVVVGSGGDLQLPLVGAVPAEGSSIGEVAEALRTTLEASYLRRAEVSVQLVSRGKALVTVYGPVEAPGAYPLPEDHRLSLHGLLVLAKGLTADADAAKLSLIRAGKCYHLSYAELLRAHFKQREVWLQPDDQVVVGSRPAVFVYGAVKEPGRLPLAPGSTLASVLVAAGGLLEDADVQEIRLLRPGTKGQGERAVLGDRLRSTGSVVYVPRSQQVYVTGEVQKSGPVSLPRSRLTVLRALGEAGWFTDVADVDGTRILRTLPGREPITILVPVSEILDGTRSEREFPLLPGDLVTVPERRW